LKKILKIILVVLLVVFIIIQFFKPARNAAPEIATNEIEASYSVPNDVKQVLKVSCYDCHSNTTIYPWYSNIQPVAWFLSNHIADGKREINFSEFSTYSLSRQYKKFKEIGEQVKGDEMPLFSYTLIHRNAVLNPSQKVLLENWAASSMKEMELKFPPDSLRKK
jgi:Haem-binding domain